MYKQNKHEYIKLLQDCRRYLYSYSSKYHLSVYPGTALSNLMKAINNESEEQNINYAIY